MSYGSTRNIGRKQASYTRKCEKSGILDRKPQDWLTGRVQGAGGMGAGRKSHFNLGMAR
jgi:hypothetical protein